MRYNTLNKNTKFINGLIAASLNCGTKIEIIIMAGKAEVNNG